MPNWIWISTAQQLKTLEQEPWKQLGLLHAARGAGWTSFAEAFQEQWGEPPTLLEASGYDTARVIALAGIAPPPVSKDGIQDTMAWVDPEADPVPLCEGLKRRRQGQSLRIKAAASDFRLKGGRPPSGVASAALL